MTNKNMKSLRFLAILAASIGLFVSCNDNTDYSANNPYTPLKLSAKSSGFIQKGNSFNFKFLSKIDAAEKQDYIISPLSMQFLLGMILNGAQGETANEICNVLGYGDGETEAVNEYALSLLEQLPAMDKKTTLSIANAIFVDKVCTLYDSYEQTVKKHYQATVDSLDFADTQNSLKVINGWCSDHTNGMIPKAL
ncbi:MAG: hypothetical protein J5764_04105, partial [Bacteroidales bacterium]|nr:hypothetical protein [Bacteroidales bacterium]